MSYNGSFRPPMVEDEVLEALPNDQLTSDFMKAIESLK
jgi:hypothetical protein